MAKAGKVMTEVSGGFGVPNSRRSFGKMPRRRYYLIVCEGEKTEPNYFESIRKLLPPEMVKRITISGTGRNTLSLIDFTEKEVEARRRRNLPPYYKIWVVFDRDSFNSDNFDNAIASIETKTSETEKWCAAWSNEAFELWYILHFTSQTGGALQRDCYAEMLSRHLGRTYRKNAEDMFDILRPYIGKAMKRAEEALKLQTGKPYHEQNPATTVHLLVKELLSYLP